MGVGGGSEIIADCGCSRFVTVKLWLIAGGGGEVMAVCGRWLRNYTWWLVVVKDGGKIVTSTVWSWVFLDDQTIS